MSTAAIDMRSLQVELPNGDTNVQLLSFSGTEAISTLFAFELEMCSDNMAVKSDDLIGKAVTFSVKEGGTVKRKFNGYINRFIAGPLLPSRRRWYKAQVVPSLWFTTQSVNCRVFEQKTVIDIIKSVLGQASIKVDFKIQTNGQYQTRKYCVQYNESDFTFISRLMEDEGLYYFFDLKDGKHTMIIADGASSYVDCRESTVRQSYSMLVDDHISEWSSQKAYHTGEWQVDTYDMEKPANLVTGKTKGKQSQFKENKFEYLPGATNKAQIDHFAKVRMEHEESQYETVQAASTYRTFQAAGVFEVAEHDIPDYRGSKYVITTVYHYADEPEVGVEEGGGFQYQNTFACVPSNVICRPARVTAKPKIRGLLTGTVTSESKDGPQVDKYGRIKIKLHWEMSNVSTPSTDCWVRVAQPNAGNKWGSMIIPDAGQEVLVSFIDGDPDNPIVIGTVYNGANGIPLTEGGGKATQFGWRGSNGNEFVIENKKGSEKLYFYAKKDFETKIDNDEKKTVKNNKTLEVTEGNESIEIKKGNRSLKIGKGDETIEITEGNRATKMKGNDTTDITDGNYNLTLTKGNYTAKMSAGEAKLDCANDITLTSKKAITLKVGSNSIKIDMTSIELKTSTGSIKLDPKGLTAKGLQVEIKGDIATKVEGGVQAEVKGGAMASIQASGMVEVKGGIAKIN